jgi:hypothetical protein
MALVAAFFALRATLAPVPGLAIRMLAGHSVRRKFAGRPT